MESRLQSDTEATRYCIRKRDEGAKSKEEGLPEG